MLRAVTAVAAALLVATSFTYPEQEAVCSDVGCEYRLTDPERSAVTNPVQDQAANNTDDITHEVTTDPCPWIVVDTAGPDSSWWEGNDPSSGPIELNQCALSDGSGPGAMPRSVI